MVSPSSQRGVVRVAAGDLDILRAERFRQPNQLGDAPHLQRPTANAQRARLKELAASDMGMNPDAGNEDMWHIWCGHTDDSLPRVRLLRRPSISDDLMGVILRPPLGLVE